MKISIDVDTLPAYSAPSSEDDSTWSALRLLIKSLENAPLTVPRGEYRRIPVRDATGSKVGTLIIDNQE